MRAGRRLPAALLAAAWLQAPGAPGPSPSDVAATPAPTRPEARLPRVPHRTDLEAVGRLPGRRGGELHMLVAGPKDVRLMVVYGYARLVGFDSEQRLAPDILEAVEVDEGRRFTLRLRAGHRWSDGHPFTSEDFRYYWEDIAGNEALSPFGLPPPLLVEGERPVFEVIDRYTVRYTWPRPNPFFLPALAGARPLYVYAPSHFLRRYHRRYRADPEALAQEARAAGVRNWAALHNRMYSPYRNTVVGAPSLQPWVNTTPAPAQRFVFVRNPYFHRVDGQGRQLPYIDRVILHVVDRRLIAAKTAAGETDLQARGLRFGDYTLLKRAERERGGQLRVRLWRTTKGADVALFPNLNADDPLWRSLLRDVRFRRALSLAIDRHEINQVIYYGLALEGNNTVQPSSPLYRPLYRTAWARFDPGEANRLLDELGLTGRDARGVRTLPDGRPLEIVVETAGESTEQSDVLELVHDGWRRAGVKLFTKPLQREVLRNRVFSGKTLVSVWGGLENGAPTPAWSPHELAPTSQQQLQWPRWGQHFETKGRAGAAPDLPAARALLALFHDWVRAGSDAERAGVWHEMLALHAENAFTLGLVAGVPQPVVSDRRLRNLPDDGIYSWEPGAHFGVYRLDTLWFDDD